ncbi:flagellin [Methylobacterium brachythecii]|uniref:Flagellar protein n=1 Tax=Methylobacterium brachythecii TaxID=1176177 RepID=A0A7W6AKH8_9HYPH|nr:flagellin [Methylobacterium brachythecii]MBB3901442.1 flagellin-like hook-associated protein FlgL [Methylobacterium brachythecii]GLS43014.1 flagellar protein [Methylobacterium brachythecii]
MTTINSFAAGSYAADRTAASLLTLKSRLDGLTNQLSTGRVADTYGGLGSARTASLSAHATISALDGYVASINGGSTQVNLAATSLTQVKKLADTLGTSLTTNLQSSTSTGITTSVALAKSGLDGAIDALNQSAAGKYIFGGRTTDKPPVVSSDLMLNGDSLSGLAGLKDLIAEQRKADLGPGNNGRLTQTQSGTTVSLTEDANAEARANFGFSLLSATSSNTSGIAANLTPGTAAAVDLSFASQPSDGDRVRVAVLQPDGSQKILDLTARSSVAAGSTDSFAIGATPADTAANLKTLLGGASIASVQSASPPGVSAAFSGGSPASLQLSAGTPAAGDTITLTVGLRDGTTQSITLTAAATADPTSTSSFTIGATPAQTAANVSAALSNALQQTGKTALSASSAVRAADNFFDGSSSAGLAPRRVSADGNGYAETASKSTVIWYTGDDAATDPRATTSVQIGADRTVAIGARANEQPLRDTLAGFAVLAADSFTDATGTQDAARYQATASRVQGLVEPGDTKTSVADMVGEFGIASSTMADAKTQAQSTKNTLLDSIQGVEQVSTEEVAAKLMTLQTQLQASYQVTSMLSKLSLVNYLS